MSYSNLSFIATNRPLEPFHSPGMARAGPLDLAGVRCKPPESRKTFSGSNGTAYQSHSVVDYLPPDGISDRGKFFPQMESRGPRNGVIASQCRPVNLIHCVSGSRRPPVAFGSMSGHEIASSCEPALLASGCVPCAHGKPGHLREDLFSESQEPLRALTMDGSRPKDQQIALEPIPRATGGLNVDFQQRLYPCPRSGCGADFTEVRSLERHVRTTHEKTRPFHCPYLDCEFFEKGFGRMETYEKHVKRKHEQQRVNCGEMTAWWRYVFIGTSSDCSSRDPSSNMRGNAYSLFVVCFRKTPRGSVNRNELLGTR